MHILGGLYAFYIKIHGSDVRQSRVFIGLNLFYAIMHYFVR